MGSIDSASDGPLSPCHKQATARNTPRAKQHIATSLSLALAGLVGGWVGLSSEFLPWLETILVESKKDSGRTFLVIFQFPLEEIFEVFALHHITHCSSELADTSDESTEHIPGPSLEKRILSVYAQHTAATWESKTGKGFRMQRGGGNCSSIWNKTLHMESWYRKKSFCLAFSLTCSLSMCEWCCKWDHVYNSKQLPHLHSEVVESCGGLYHMLYHMFECSVILWVLEKKLYRNCSKEAWGSMR